MSIATDGPTLAVPAVGHDPQELAACFSFPPLQRVLRQLIVSVPAPPPTRRQPHEVWACPSPSSPSPQCVGQGGGAQSQLVCTWNRGTLGPHVGVTKWLVVWWLSHALAQET